MKKRKHKRVAIVGAGFAGREIAADIQKKEIFGKVSIFLDDDPKKIGTRINGIPVEGPITDAGVLFQSNPIDQVIIAIPGASKDQLKTIYKYLEISGISQIKILPGISQIINGDAHLIQARTVSPQDLLGRTPVVIALRESLEYLRGKRVLITGAGGSIGRELARQLLSGGAERLFLFDHSENNVYELEKELRIYQAEGIGEKAVIVPVVGDLKDRDYIMFIIKRLKADVIFHCAAYKHVPMMEANPIEAVINNVFGTKNIIDAAIESNASRFILISTDKAVEPSSIYGITKMLSEEIVLGEKRTGKLDSIVVRFGNVLGSRGSIMPLFKKQILAGGPVTITHKQTSRFFMTIPEASSLVLKVGGVGINGNLYILEMGESINITDLAKQMIRFYGFQPEEEIKISYIGLRPGEKLTEKLWGKDESPVNTEYSGIQRVIRESKLNEKLEPLLESLKKSCYFNENNQDQYRNRKHLRKILNSFIPTLIINDDEPEF